LALGIYRTLTLNNQALTDGIIKAITMAYQDMFRVKEGDQGRVMHCMFRVPSFRFRRSLSMHYLKEFTKRAPAGGWEKFELGTRLAKRAIHFHSLIKVNQGKPKGTLDGLEVVPLDAAVHFEEDRPNKPRSAVQSPMQRGEEGKGPENAITVTQDYITLTSGSDITPTKATQFLPTPSGTMSPFTGSFMPMAQGSPTFPAA
jgi:hypothetical protein